LLGDDKGCIKDKKRHADIREKWYIQGGMYIISIYLDINDIYTLMCAYYSS